MTLDRPLALGHYCAFGYVTRRTKASSPAGTIPRTRQQPGDGKLILEACIPVSPYPGGISALAWSGSPSILVASIRNWPRPCRHQGTFTQMEPSAPTLSGRSGPIATVPFGYSTVAKNRLPWLERKLSPNTCSALGNVTSQLATRSLSITGRLRAAGGALQATSVLRTSKSTIPIRGDKSILVDSGRLPIKPRAERCVMRRAADLRRPRAGRTVRKGNDATNARSASRRTNPARA